MKEKCMNCKNIGYDEYGGHFYTETCKSCRELPRFSFYIASQSAKPGQAHIPASPCPADTLNTPPNSRHPGAKDCEVKHV